MIKCNLKKLINFLFLLCIFLYILCSFIKSFINPKEIIELENRYANNYSSISLTKYLDGSMQDNIENTLSDQVFLSEKLKKGNNLIKGILIKNYVDSYYKNNKLDYLTVNGVNFYGSENLVYNYGNINDIKKSLDKKIDNYNEFSIINKDIETYLYYIERDADINFNTNEKSMIYEYIEKRLNNIESSKFNIDNFNDFRKYFYKTDHHWNYYGSYKAYLEVLNLLEINNSLKYEEKVCLNKYFSGSKASASVFNKVMKDKFCAYKFNFTDMDILVNGKDMDYGLQNEFLNNTANININYGAFYGGDDGEIIFKNNLSKSKDNILIIGESYDNAILKLLAESFNTTISIDLRNYNYYKKKDFNFEDYKDKYNINKVLFIGNVDFYASDIFMV